MRMEAVIMRDSPVGEVFKDEDLSDWLEGKVEWARSQLRIRKRVPLTIFLLSKKGDGTSVQTEITRISGTELIRPTVDQISTRFDVYVYCVVFEGWMLDDPELIDKVDYTKESRPLEKHPKKKETVLAVVETLTFSKHICAEILRKPNGDPYIGKLKEIPTNATAEGYATGILFKAPIVDYKFMSATDSDFNGSGVCARMNQVNELVGVCVEVLERRLGRTRPEDIKIDASYQENPK